MVPLFVGALKLDQKTAVATSLAIIVITALSGTLSNLHSKAGLIDWRIVAFAAVGAATASWFGAEWMRSLSNQTLTKTFGIILLVSGLRMILAKG